MTLDRLNATGDRPRPKTAALFDRLLLNIIATEQSEPKGIQGDRKPVNSDQSRSVMFRQHKNTDKKRQKVKPSVLKMCLPKY